MMKFTCRFRSQGNEPQSEKIKQDLFAFNKMVEHGFPSQPSALAYDHMLQLMAIGTKSGSVKVYGKPGVEFTGVHKETAAITQIHFLPGQGRLVSLLDDNTLHLWEVRQTENQSHLEESRGFALPGRPGLSATSSARVTVLLVTGSCDLLCLGTERGGVHFLQLPQLQPSGARPLFHEEIMQSVPEDYRCGKSLGPVESLQEHPQCTGKILIGYSRGLLVLWDLHTRRVDGLFLGNQQLESVCWDSSGEILVSSHSDGTYAVWAVEDANPCAQQPVSSVAPYGGSFPCKAISKILWRRAKLGAALVLFSGGMPRASYGDRHCVTVLQENTQVALDFTSRVIDFFTVHNTDSDKSFDDPTALVVLLEEELVVIDLQTTGWPTIPCPYLAPLHSSAITCSYHVSDVPSKLWERIIHAGQLQCPALPEGKWPISGGNNLAADPQQHELLLTGHEDGTVRFWDGSRVSLKLLYTLRTAGVFQTDGDHGDGDHGDGLSQTGEEAWPPFRKVGCFDPYSDDPRLGIQEVCLCKYSGRLAVAGTSGQVLVMRFCDEASDHMIDMRTVDLLHHREGFTWKGHDQLTPKTEPLSFAPGFQPVVLVQCMPPAAITAVTLHAEWNFVAFGTSHGFCLFDYHRLSAVLARCTLHPNDSLALEGPLSRIKSLKKSLRQSFRRIRKSRVSGKKFAPVKSPGGKVQEARVQLTEQMRPPYVGVTPAQRRVEPRSADDSLSGVVRCLYLTDTYLRDGMSHGPSVWAGTNSGTVYAYALELPLQKSSERGVEVVLGKEIQLMHRAPVVAIAVLDGQGVPLPEPYEACQDLAKAPDMQGSHSLLIASEEQLKVFTLPKVSAKTKLKLTAREGCRVRKVALARFGSATAEEYGEDALVCLTNLGDVRVFSLPALRPQVRYDCVRKEDIAGIASCTLTRTGQGFYLTSPSEFKRFSLSTRAVVEARCSLDVKRPHDSPALRDDATMALQANGTRKAHPAGESLSLPEAEGVPDEMQSSLSSPSLDSASSCADITLDITGDIISVDVKGLLISRDETDNNFRYVSEEPGLPPGILIN